MGMCTCLENRFPIRMPGRSDSVTTDSKVHGANTGPIWGRQDPGGLHVGPMNFAIWDSFGGMFWSINSHKRFTDEYVL